MSLNKICNQTNTGSERWMHITCKDILADEVKGEQIFANTVTSAVTASEEVKCGDLIVQNNTFPVKTFFTTAPLGIGFNDPETNVLINGIGSTSYFGNDIVGSSTQITSLLEFIFQTNDVYKFRLKRGGTVLKEFNFQYTGAASTQMARVIWAIDTRTVGTSGTIMIQLDIKSGDLTNAISTADPRYLFKAEQNDTTLQGDYEFTIEPVAVNVSGSCAHWQSTITRSHSIQV